MCDCVMFFQAWLNGFNKLKDLVQLVTQKALCVLSYEVICNLKEMKLHHIYTLIYAMTMAKQSSNIQNNIGVNHSHNILLLQRKLNAVATFPVKLQYTKKPSPTEDP